VYFSLYSVQRDVSLGKRGEMRPTLCWGSLRVRNHLKELGIDGRIISKLIFKKYYGTAWSR
jgi:hypothetical protein